MKYFFIAGEESGSNYAASVIQQLILIDEKSKFYGLGNNLMNLQGCDIIIPIQELAFMGFSDVVKNIFTIKRNFSKTKNAILDIQPDVICLIDYAGFNLKMAKWCKQNGFKVLYYILPKVWAWNESRINILKQYCDELICIFPFEKKYFDAKNIHVHYFGNPLLEKKINYLNNDDANKIALLPGSRKQEIKYLMPIFLELAINNMDKEYIIAGIEKLKAYYPTKYPNNIKIIYNDLDYIISQSKCAIVCSGTATLEVALQNIPQVVVYKTNKVNYFLGKMFIKVKYISLPNLITNKKIVQELIQHDCTVENINNSLSEIENKKDIYKEMFSELDTNFNVSKSVAEKLFGLAFK